MAKRILITFIMFAPYLTAHALMLELETDEPDKPVMRCIEWSDFVQSMADTGIERFWVIAREYIHQSKWPFLELAGEFVSANQLNGSPVAGTMAFVECRGIP